MTASLLRMHLVVTCVAQADQVAVLQRQVRSVFEVLDVMDRDSFDSLAVPLTVLAQITVTSQHMLTPVSPCF